MYCISKRGSSLNESKRVVGKRVSSSAFVHGIVDGEDMEVRQWNINWERLKAQRKGNDKRLSRSQIDTVKKSVSQEMPKSTDSKKEAVIKKPVGQVVIVCNGYAGCISAALFLSRGYEVTIADRAQPYGEEQQIKKAIMKSKVLSLSKEEIELLAELGVEPPVDLFTPGLSATLDASNCSYLNKQENFYVESQQFTLYLQRQLIKKYKTQLTWLHACQPWHIDHQGNQIELYYPKSLASNKKTSSKNKQKTKLRYDLLIAADGVNSAVRDLLENMSDFQVQYASQHSPQSYKYAHDIDQQGITDALGPDYNHSKVHTVHLRPTPDSKYGGMTLYRTHKSSWSCIVYRTRIGTWSARDNSCPVKDLQTSFPQISDSLVGDIVRKLKFEREEVGALTLECPSRRYHNCVLLGGAAQGILAAQQRIQSRVLQDVAVLRDMLASADKRFLFDVGNPITLYNMLLDFDQEWTLAESRSKLCKIGKNKEQAPVPTIPAMTKYLAMIGSVWAAMVVAVQCTLQGFANTRERVFEFLPSLYVKLYQALRSLSVDVARVISETGLAAFIAKLNKV